MKKRWKQILRDLALLVVILQVVEMWQARALPHGSFPVDIAAMTRLEGSANPVVEPGRSRLVYAFAPWCGVCRMSAANLNRLSFLGIDIVAVALSYESIKDVRAFVASTGLAVPVVLGDAKSEEALAVNAFPTYFLLSPTGTIVKSWSGYTTTVGLWAKVALMPLWRLVTAGA